MWCPVHQKYLPTPVEGLVIYDALRKKEQEYRDVYQKGEEAHTKGAKVHSEHQALPEARLRPGDCHGAREEYLAPSPVHHGPERDRHDRRGWTMRTVSTRGVAGSTRF